MKVKKILAIETVYGHQYEFTLSLEEDKWEDLKSLLILGEELLLEKYGKSDNIIQFNVLNLN